MTAGVTRRDILGAGGAALALGAGIGHPGAQAPVTLKVISFPGLSDLPTVAADHKGFFSKYGLVLNLTPTPSSDFQRASLAKGDFQIAHTAADNVVAMVENAKADVVIVTGGDNGFNRIMTQPEIKTLADVRGKTVVVDSPVTAYALLLYKALKNAGLNKGDYSVYSAGGTTQRVDTMLHHPEKGAAAVINVPFNYRLLAAGMNDLGSATASIGSYQAAATVAVMRDWAKKNHEILVRYLKAIISGRRFVLDPANRAEVIQLMIDRIKLDPQIVSRVYDYVTDPKEGYNRDMRFDREALINVLRLRAELQGQWGGTPPAPEKYYDLSYYNEAIAGL